MSVQVVLYVTNVGGCVTVIYSTSSTSAKTGFWVTKVPHKTAGNFSESEYFVPASIFFEGGSTGHLRGDKVRLGRRRSRIVGTSPLARSRWSPRTTHSGMRKRELCWQRRRAHLVSTDTRQRSISGKPNGRGDAALSTRTAAFHFFSPCGSGVRMRHVSCGGGKRVRLGKGGLTNDKSLCQPLPRDTGLPAAVTILHYDRKKSPPPGGVTINYVPSSWTVWRRPPLKDL